MKLFRLRFIILGLLLCVFHVWCRTCGTELTDPASSAYLAGVVVEGRVAQTLPPDHSDQFNVTIRIRSVYKGSPSTKKGRLLTIGKFGQESDEENCIYTSVRRGSTRFVFFLKETEQNYYTLSAFPVKFSKKIGRQIRKILCKRGTCGKPPTLRKIKVRKYKTGRPILLRCRIRSSKPDAVFTWLKDGQEIRSRRVRIKSSKRGSRLKINKANAGDGGTYTCKATNVLGSTEALAKVKVLPSKPKPTRKTTRGPTTDVVSHPPAFVACGPEKAGYCLNTGECRVIVSMNVTKCQCPETHQGTRCQYRRPFVYQYSEGPQAHEKDRTITIIGIVIGILIFVCICIASYFLAKKRREQFLQRQEDKKRKNSKLDSQVYIPPSYRLLNSMDDVDGGTAPKIKTLPPSLKEHINMETQTDETSFMPVNPNINMRIHNNPLNKISQHLPPSQANSRNRLSAVSVDGKPSRTAAGDSHSPRSSRSRSIPQDATPGTSKEAKPKGITDPPPPYNGCAPVIPVLRMDSAGSEEEDSQNTEALIPLHISEGEDERSLNSPTYGSTPFGEKKIFNSHGKSASSRQIDTKAEVPVYVNANGVGSQSSLTSSDSSTTGSADSEVSAVYNYPLYNSQTKDYPDSISWNERGSPEHVIADKDCPVLPGKKPQINYVDKSYLPPKKLPRAGYHDMHLEKNKLRNVNVSEPSVPV
ncbi:pro-neuregulin-1, membrane-bound isoform-like isoform X2 [Pecten maximus]|uniref:pro-neuregulin-1, membrane-bound isoform-like isoform X2 n=1 Tax=Pecten maximus TaxID=6579 RepID=UPI0014588C09|nr:pro-neuregulin-1, membrane-bound isoform-like isoform X2 [Pecten maximus]